jgi:hypothetical protein
MNKTALMFAFVLGLATVFCGCGKEPSSLITPPENPTPLPDPDSMIEFGGDKAEAENTQPLKR